MSPRVTQTKMYPWYCANLASKINLIDLNNIAKLTIRLEDGIPPHKTNPGFYLTCNMFRCEPSQCASLTHQVHRTQPLLHTEGLCPYSSIEYRKFVG